MPDQVPGKNGGTIFRWKPGECPNPKGRPRKLISKLKKRGYKSSEVNDCILVMAAMTVDELKDVYENPDSTVLEKAIASSLKEDIKKGKLESFEKLLSRAMGKPTQNLDLTTKGEKLPPQPPQIIIQSAGENCPPITEEINDESE